MAIERLVIDSSALVAISFLEFGFEVLRKKAIEAETSVIPAPIALEAAMVLTGKIAKDSRLVIAGFLSETNSTIMPFGEEEYRLATAAFLNFGKGRHPAALNILDCMAYAAAISLDAHLLFKGTDFDKTDVKVA